MPFFEDDRKPKLTDEKTFFQLKKDLANTLRVKEVMKEQERG
jgi:hypothetical protein